MGGLALCACVAVPAPGQTLQDWQVACDAGRCTASQTVAAGDGTWLATVRLANAAQPAETVLAEVLVPAGVHLTSGLFLGFDGEMAQAQWQRCTEQACRAVLGLDAAMQADWRRGAASEIRYRPAPDAPVIAFELSLMGVTDALAAMDVAQ